MDKTVKQFSTSGDDITLINQFTKRELTAGEVYTFSVILCDNEVDRDFERFDDKALESLQNLYIGKTGVFDHEAKGKNQHARIYYTELVVDKEKQTSQGVPYTFVKAKAYMVKSEGNSELMLEIDGGIKKEVSVSCSVASTTCSICGSELRDGGCNHKRGKTYENAVCHYILSEVSDVYEWSFVAVPAQKNAGVTKAFKGKEVECMNTNDKSLADICKAFTGVDSGNITISKSEANTVVAEFARLERLALMGNEYRLDLMSEVKRMAFLVDGALPASVVGSVLDKLNIDEIKAFKKSYEQKLENGSGSIQLMQRNTGNIGNLGNSNQFKI